MVGLPLHLWTCETLKQIGDGCGGFLKVDKETVLRIETSWARILVKLKEMARPSTVISWRVRGATSFKFSGSYHRGLQGCIRRKWKQL